MTLVLTLNPSPGNSESNSRGGGGGLPYKKDMDAHQKFILNITPEDHVLWVWLEIFFTPKRHHF